MSAWLRLVNDIKRTASEAYLTPQQHDMWQALCTLLTFPQRINLWGPGGSGKTFVAWMVTRSTGAVHIPLPAQIETVEPGTESLLIDNAPTDEAAVRSLWARCNLLSVRSVVVITQEPITIATRTLVLPPPTIDEWRFVCRTIMQLGHLPPSPIQEFPSFWAFLRNCV